MQKEENEIKKMNDENIQNNIVFEEEESKQEEIDDQNMSIDKIDQNSSQEIPQNSMILPENKIKSNNVIIIHHPFHTTTSSFKSDIFIWLMISLYVSGHG